MDNAWFKSYTKGLSIVRNIVEQVGDHVMVTDRDGMIEYVNPAFEKTTGYAQKEVLGKNPRILRSGKHPLKDYQELWQTILAGKVYSGRIINKKKDGQLYVTDQTISPILNKFHEVSHFVCIGKDITQFVRAEELLKFEKEKLEEIISFDEHLSKIRKSDQLIDFVVVKTKKILEVEKCSVMLIDEETNQLYTKAMEGFAQDASMQINIPGSIAEPVIAEGHALLVNDFKTDSRFKDVKQDPYLGNAFMIAPIRLGQHVIGVINVADKRNESKKTGIFDNIDLKILCAISTEMAVAIENVSFYKELHYLTITDPLTHVHNYRHFVNSMDYELGRLKRFPGELALLMMDIDNFKSYNDRLGHLAGDELLKKIAQMVHLHLREVDIFCRYGGDEFVIILPGINNKGAMIVAEKIRQCIEDAKFQESVTLSIGVAQYKDKMTRHELTFKADRALYQAKAQGNNRVCVFGQD